MRLAYQAAALMVAGVLFTVQLTCWDSSGSVVACAGTGHDGETQTGAALAFVDNGDGTITDLNTGLVWEKKSDDGSIHDKDRAYMWKNAFAVHVAGLNDPNAPFAGYTDWRVPNYEELLSILDLEELPALDPVFNTGCVPACTVLTCSCTRSYRYWSSSSGASGTPGAYNVLFNDGIVVYGNWTISHHVRAVRGGL